MADPLKFRAAAERLYRAEGASAQEARDLAEAWFARIREDDLGFRSDGNDFVQLAGAGTGTKRSEEHTSELQSLMRISYAVFCLKNKNHINRNSKVATHIVKKKYKLCIESLLRI